MTVPWERVKEEYKAYKSFDGVDIRDRMALSDRHACELDPRKKLVFRMFLNVTRKDNIPVYMYHTPQQLKQVYKESFI